MADYSNLLSNPYVEVVQKRKDAPLIVIRDKDLEPQAPKRVQLTLRQLSRSLGYSRDEARDLLIGYLRGRQIHLQSQGEQAAGMGLMSEELAIMLLLMHVHITWSAQPEATGQLASELLRSLLGFPTGMRIVVVLIDNGRERRARVEHAPQGTTFTLPRVTDARVVVFDVTAFAEAIEKAFDEEPFRIPRLGDFEVKS